MPIIKLKRKSQVCYKFGQKGKVYCGKNALQKAKKQGRAIKTKKIKLRCC